MSIPPVFRGSLNREAVDRAAHSGLNAGSAHAFEIHETARLRMMRQVGIQS